MYNTTKYRTAGVLELTKATTIILAAKLWSLGSLEKYALVREILQYLEDE